MLVGKMSEHPLHPNTIIAMLKCEGLQPTTIVVPVIVFAFAFFGFFYEMLAFLDHIYLTHNEFTSLNLLFKIPSPILPIPAPQSSTVAVLRFLLFKAKLSKN